MKSVVGFPFVFLHQTLFFACSAQNEQKAVSPQNIALTVNVSRYKSRKSTKPLSLLDPLHIYFINLDHSTDRHQQFQRSINLLPSHLRNKIRLKRVLAITSEDVKHMISSRKLVLNWPDTLVEPNVSHKWWDKKYTAKEVACTLSHLKAIRQAYLNGHESVLIVEDDAVLTRLFLENWRSYIYLAPVDWAVLQWSTNNAVFNRKESHRSRDFWISWAGYHWSTIAYTIRRKGMKSVLNHTSNIFRTNEKDASVPIKWMFDETSILKADELIYYLAEKTYTSSHCWVTPFTFNSTIDRSHISSWNFGQSNFVPSINHIKHLERSEKILVLQSIRIDNAKDVLAEMNNLHADVCALARFNPQSTWFVKVVITQYYLMSMFHERSSELSKDHVQLQITFSKEPSTSNNIVFLREKLDDFSSFDYVLLKDSGIRLAGFEWNTFLNASNNSLMSGPYRQRVEKTMSRYKRVIHEYQSDRSTYVNLQDAALFNSYQDEDFRDVVTKPVIMLEDFMVMMKSHFAVWFLTQVLTKEFLLDNMDLDLDLMWCTAAYDFQYFYERSVKHNRPCSLISLNINDSVRKQQSRPKGAESSHAQRKIGHRVLNGTREITFKRWKKASDTSRLLKYSWLKKWCLINSMNARIGDCLKDFHKERVKNYVIWQQHFGP